MTLDLPSALSERVLNALKADPRTVDLRSLAPHFYSLGVRVLELFEEDHIVDILSEVSAGIYGSCRHLIHGWLTVMARQTFRRRASEIADHAHNSRGALGEGVEFLRGLDETERQCAPVWYARCS